MPEEGVAAKLAVKDGKRYRPATKQEVIEEFFGLFGNHPLLQLAIVRTMAEYTLEQPPA